MNVMTKAELHDIVDQLPDDAVEGASFLLRRVVTRQLDPTQAWVWTEEWLCKLNGSVADIQAGRVNRFGSDEEFFEAL